ncbi:hypothetical protein ACT3TZ_12445 [Brachybacterium sp. AOP25-B2-12]|uniref:hypothetical protein n=1 Tax=Brachybacterium sp. AOP25-B2-12 TaxID=3457710 RepID=UPI004034BD48
MTTSTPAAGPHATTPEDFPGSMLTDGRIAWLPGFLGVLGVLVLVGGPPFLGYISMSVAWVILGLLQRTNPVARRTGRRAAIVGGAHLLLLAAVLGVRTALTGATVETAEPFDVMLVFPGTVYIVMLAPLVGITLGVMALIAPISRARAARALARR